MFQLLYFRSYEVIRIQYCIAFSDHLIPYIFNNLVVIASSPPVSDGASVSVCVLSLSFCVSRFMPCLKYIIQNATTDSLRLLRGKTIECISLIGLAVGREKVTSDIICYLCKVGCFFVVVDNDAYGLVDFYPGPSFA